MMAKKLFGMIKPSYPLTHIQMRLIFKFVKILELQQIASNLPDVFTDYKGVTKSLNPAVNVPCRVEVTIKTTPPPKRGRASQQKDAPTKRLRTTRKISSSKTVNASQTKVDGHQVDTINP
jgi:hypothetical protein